MKVSIVITNYNGRKILETNLPQVIANAPDCEIIVVDDASTDDSVEFLKKNFGDTIKIIQHSVNKRYSVSCNDGVKRATGEIIILLNSDVVPHKGFLKPLLAHFSDPQVFSVGCKEIQINPFDKTAKPVIAGRTEGEFRRGFLVHWSTDDQESQETLWTVGGSMAVHRAKYLKLGGLDELYSPAYWEDIDLSYRAKQQGWKVIFEKDSVVDHYHATTNISVFGRDRIDLMAYRNQILFVWKNIRGTQLLQHFVWLPYHIVFTGFRSKGVFLKGLWQAVVRWMEFKRG